MPTQGRLTWSARPQAGAGTEEYVFQFDPALGLRDVDFHAVTDAVLERLPRPTGRVVILVPPNTPMGDIDRAARLLTSKGGFESVDILIHTP